MQTQPNIIDAGDVLIVGAGLAGLFTALKLSHRQVTVMTAEKPKKGSASAWAQGGIAAALGEDDHADLHVADTVKAGAGLVDENIARILAEESKARVNDLIAFGVPFDRLADGRLKLGREAAHSRNRIVGVSGDRAGREIMSALGQRATQSPSIRKLVGYSAYELAVEDGRVVGVFARPVNTQGPVSPMLIKARAVILACGGSGHLYKTTTNPIFAKGEAIAMAARAGAVIADPEFIQFHPTAFTGLGDPAPLATEALRGEGAKLVNAKGVRFMLDIHEDAELAPRDVVARAVFDQIRNSGGVSLDLRGHLAEHLGRNFPTVAGYCDQAGIDPKQALIPIEPAAHYHMGGIKVDEHGRSTLPGLWACGEAAATGAHGANRLASNSLLEAIVFGARIAQNVDSSVPVKAIAVPEPAKTEFNEQEANMPAIAELRETMSRYVGVVRSRQSLTTALEIITRLNRIASGVAPLANMTTTALLITTAALQREESRGGHFRSDYPMPVTNPERTFMTLDQCRAIARKALGTGSETKADQTRMSS
ncbi:MAG: L-aspartate oxidase [Parvibaculales bacterium]